MAAVETFLDEVSTGPTALVIRGEAGIGKSALWRAGVASARSRSFRVLLCRPAEAEVGFSFVALADLLQGVPEDAFASLPLPQREALGVALSREDSARELDRVALARGALAVVSGVASGGPTVIAIDDAQWLDASSRDALRFVLRRLAETEQVGFLATVRGDERGALVDIHVALFRERVVQLVLGPLPPGELERLVRSRHGISLSRPSWRAVYRVSGGNPLFALQIAEAVADEGGLSPGEDPPLPDTVTAAVRARLDSLSRSALRSLLPAAALGRPTRALLSAAGADESGIFEALDAGVLELEGDRVRFAHPLFAATIYLDAPAARRREVHRLLADVVDDPEECALHLGRGGEVPDEAVAALLEAAAGRAVQRGAPEAAAELGEHARRLTPADRSEDAARRSIDVARYVGRAGDLGRAVELLRNLAATLPAGNARARALALLGFIARDAETIMRAIDEAEDDPTLLAIAHADVSAVKLRRGDREGAIAHAETAVASARASGDPATLAKALAARAMPDAQGRAEAALALLHEAVELERRLARPVSLVDSPSTWLGAVLLDADRFAEARQVLEEACQRGLALGHASRALPLTYLAELELREGNWDRALAASLEAEGLWTGGPAAAVPLVSHAIVDAHLGNAEAARAAGDRGIELLSEIGHVVTVTQARWALGLLELSLGDFGRALERLDPVVALPEGEPLCDATSFRASAAAVEALLGLGRTAEAEHLAGRVERRARRAGLPSWLAAASRCRALMLAEHGDGTAAREAIGAALVVHHRHREPFEHGRTLLAAGSIERRAKGKARAREALESALEIFERLGARLWCLRVRAELERAGLRRAAPGGLTTVERQVADLAAGGATNKEIAAALYMSVKTVEAHLSRVYRKLDVRSRTELAAHRGQPAE